MEIDKKKILIGVGVLVIGYLAYKSMKNNKQPINIQTIVEEPSEVVANKNIPRGGLAMPLQETDLLTLSRIPNEFTVNSNGFSTRYYKNILQTKTGFSSMFATPDVYKQPFTHNSFSGVQPIKISVREFSDAYYGMEPKS